MGSEMTESPGGLIVLGVHRSGTSAATGVLRAAGLRLPEERFLMPAGADNPSGFFENQALVEVNDELLERLGGDWSAPPRPGPGWEGAESLEGLRRQGRALFRETMPPERWVWKDPRTCLTLPFWLGILEARPVVLLVHRDPGEVARSLGKRNGFPPLLGIALWERYLRDALVNVVGLPVVTADYAGLLLDPVGWLRRVSEDLAALGVPVEEVDEAAATSFVERPGGPPSGGRTEQLSAEQGALLDAVRSLDHRYGSFPSLELPGATPWAEAVLEQRREYVAEHRRRLAERQEHNQQYLRWRARQDDLRRRYRRELRSKPFWWRKGRGAYRRARELLVRDRERGEGAEKTGLRAAAVVAVRNEEFHVEYTVRDLIAEGLDVVLIDNGSTDATVPKARQFLGHGLLAIEEQPYEEGFSLPKMLERKAEIIRSLDHDWAMHVDVDEWVTSRFEDETLRDRMAVADAEGFNVLHFDEFDFVAHDDEDLRGCDYRRRMLRYYFFEPTYPRLMRAWKRDSDVGLGGGSGERLVGDVRRYPEAMILRHYVSLGHAHVCDKYLNRRFAADGIERGWHRNRIGLTPEALRVRPSPALKELDRWDSKDFDRSTPTRVHFWDPAWGTDASFPETPRRP